jgi:hypothetical protein
MDVVSVTDSQPLWTRTTSSYEAFYLGKDFTVEEFVDVRLQINVSSGTRRQQEHRRYERYCQVSHGTKVCLTQLNIDRGFHAMIPTKQEEEAPPTEFNHSIKFSLFGRTFSLSLEVQKKQE